MGIAEEAIAKIKSADDAGMVAARIMREFGLIGTVFIPADITEHTHQYVRDNDTFDQLDSDDLDALEGEVETYCDFGGVADRMTELGNQLIADIVEERMRELGV